MSLPICVRVAVVLDSWTLALAKRDFGVGYLTDFHIERAPMVSGWVVQLRGGTNRGPLVDARSKTARVFKTLDSAVAAIESIGFKVEGLGRM